VTVMSLDRFQQVRILEALLFAAAEPMPEAILQSRLPEGIELRPLLEELKGLYANRGVNVVKVGKGWALRTAADLKPHLKIETVVKRRLSRAAIETLAIIAYHQPVTRAEIEDIRGVAVSRGTLDILLEAGWIRPRGRRRAPGKPVTWGTSEAFLDHFGLEGLDALPGIEELKATGLLDRRTGVGTLAMQTSEAGEEDDEDDQDADLEDDEEPLDEGDDLSDEELLKDLT